MILSPESGAHKAAGRLRQARAGNREAQQCRAAPERPGGAEGGHDDQLRVLHRPRLGDRPTRSGITDEHLLALPRYQESELFTDLEKLVLGSAGFSEGMVCAAPDHG
jgi:hypothetical protein